MTWSNFIEGSGQVTSAILKLVAAPVLGYFVMANSLLLVLTGLAIWEFLHHSRRKGYAGSQESVSSQLAQGVSVVVPAFNEEAVIVTSVHAVLALRYPRHEVIVVDDGSTDETFERLFSSFDLVPVPTEIPSDLPTRGRIIDVHVPRDGLTPLVVVRKESSGRADADNVGINAAAESLVAFMDADLILDPQALVEVTKPFADDPTRVVATGGVMRVGNGSTVVDGRMVEVLPPRAWIARIQVVEYLRSFLLGRSGWSRFGALLLVNGALSVFRRDILVEVGGYDPGCTGADFELMTRIHRHMIDTDRDYSVHFVAEQVSWKEVPTSLKVLGRQRRRWHRGLCQTLWKHRSMLLRPRYGRFGLVVLPYYWAFEVLSPLVELGALLLVVAGLVLGVVSTPYLLMFVAVVYGYGTLLTLVTLTVEEVFFHKYRRWGDLGTIAGASVAENLGYRQLTALWRLEGMWSSLRRQGSAGPARAGTGERQGLPEDAQAVSVLRSDG